jgi:hypothetical protein
MAFAIAQSRLASDVGDVFEEKILRNKVYGNIYNNSLSYQKE